MEGELWGRVYALLKRLGKGKGVMRGRFLDVDVAAVRGLLQRSTWGIVVERTVARRLTERLRAEGRAGDVPVVIVGGGLDDTLDEASPLSASGRVEVLPRGAPPERVLAALAERARPR